jgi:phosphatidate cytidylyltransferase
MRQRVLTALVGIPIILITLWFGGWWWAGFLAIVAALDVWESYRLARAGGRRPVRGIGLCLAAALAIAPMLPNLHVERGALALSVMAAFLVQILRPPAERSADDWTATLASPVYVGSLIGYGVLIRQLAGAAGLAWMVATLLLVWTNDSMAYFGGRKFGRTPFEPTLSPRKTREGALIGGAATVVLGLALPWLGHVVPAVLGPLATVAPWAMGLLALGVSIVAPAGDLAKSFLKRQVGVKDSGTLIPGHGGFLDRTDSLLFAAPIVYFGARLLGFG